MTDGSRYDDQVVWFVLGIVAVGLVARFVLLGSRIAHFDEGRVAFWTLEYLRTGQFHYRYIIHGPFIQHVDRALFALLGPTDFATRVPVALVGGLLPLSALWFRHRLSGTEIAALAFFLAFNPILLYYSRFMRSTVLVATFCFVAFAAFVRWYDGFGPVYLYAGLAMLGLGFTAKENAVLYVLCWLGAGALVLHHKAVRHEGAASGVDWFRGAVGRSWRRVAGNDRDRLGLSIAHLGVGLVVFLAVVYFFYAPRNGVVNPAHLAITEAHPRYDEIVRTCEQVGLWRSTFSGETGSLLQCTNLNIERGYGYWFGKPTEITMQTFLERFGQYLGTAASFAAPLVALALAGTVVEHYVADRPRFLVLGAAYWGFASVVGYPLGSDIWAAWIIVNALVPLAIPAAVGLALIVDTGRDAIADDDRVSVAAVAVLLLLVVGQMGLGGASGVYLAPTSPDNTMVQYAQPDQSMRPVATEMTDIAARNGGNDTLVYGSDLVDGDATADRTPACIDWFYSLPLGWYLESGEVQTTCATNDSELPEDLPPVIIAMGECRYDTNGDGTRESRPAVECHGNPEGIQGPSELRERVPASYERRGFLLRTTAKPVVVYVDTDA